MRLTIAICTWNRAQLLEQGLDRMTKVTIPPGVGWELLVVNNNCTDATDQVIKSYEARLPIRRLFEPTPGKSHALNRAVKEATGDYILWTDDDVLVDEHWVTAYVEAFRRWPDAVFFGGPVRPWFEDPPPDWLARVWKRLSGVYAMRDLGEEAQRFSGGNHIPYGANWAIRLHEQRQYSYDGRLGPQPGNAVRGEETKVIAALLAASHEGWWVPEAGVSHYVPAERMTLRYVRRWWIGEGEGHVRVSLPWTGPTFLGRPRYLWLEVVSRWATYAARRVWSPPEVWIEALIEASISSGHFQEYGRRDGSR